MLGRGRDQVNAEWISSLCGGSRGFVRAANGPSAAVTSARNLSQACKDDFVIGDEVEGTYEDKTVQ